MPDPAQPPPHRKRVLVACEFSGIVRDAFCARGHDAWSCDLLPTERPGNHFQADVCDVLRDGWDILIAHPPCTFLSLSGVRWLYRNGKGKTRDRDRWVKMRAAARFFREMLAAPIPCRAVENPIPHRHCQLEPYTQIVQPWQFGHGETKATCLWLYGLPNLQPTNIVEGRQPVVHRMSPSPERSRLRSKTYEGIALAMAKQWGEYAN